MRAITVNLIELHGIPFNGKTFSMKIMGEAIKYRVKRKKNLKNVADWDKNFVYFDEKIPQENLLPVLIHECVEKYMSEKYDLDVDRKAHRIATDIEKAIVKSMGGNWTSHQRRIAEVWKKANRKNIGSAKFF